MSWMRDLETKLSRRGQLVADLCVELFSGAKVCMLLPKYRQLVGCDIYASMQCCRVLLKHLCSRC